MLDKLRKFLDKLEEKIELFFKNNRLLVYFLLLLYAITVMLATYQQIKDIKSYTLSDKRKTNIEKEITKKYEKNVSLNDLTSFYNENKDNILQVLLPEVENVNYFQILLYETGKDGVAVYNVYKQVDEKWENIPQYNELISKVGKNKVAVGFYVPKVDILSKVLPVLVQVLVYGFFIWFLFIRGPNSITKATLRRFIPGLKNKVPFEDIGGIESNKIEIQDIVKSLKNWEKFKKRGVRTFRGILFYGPPGTGKTMLAKAIATELDTDIFIAKGTDFQSSYLNGSASKVANSFKQIDEFIKKHKKDFAILFIDEIEVIAKQRGANGNSEDDKVVNTLLDKLDGIEGSSNIIIIGATNYIEKVDEAFLSRFDKKIPFKLPTKKERLEIINKKINKIKEVDPEVIIDENIDVSIFAGNTVGLSGRDIENILNEVHRVALLYEQNIDEKLIHSIFADYILGKDNLGVEVNKNDLEVVTCHEVGHAIVGHMNGKQVHTVTITPKGSALGITWSLDKYEGFLSTPTKFVNQIRELVAGRMAEKLYKGEVTTGASNDYDVTSNIAFNYFTKYNLSYKGYSLGFIPTKNHSIDRVLKELEPHVKKMIEDQETFVLNYLKNNREKMDILIEKLKKDKIIFRSDILELFPRDDNEDDI